MIERSGVFSRRGPPPSEFLSHYDAATIANGGYTSGYGTIGTVNGAGAQQRSGQAVARFTF